MSVIYTVRVEYALGRRPKVVVLDPRLKAPPDSRLPHVYPGAELCLYYSDEFDGRVDLLADTVVPWTSEWLYFYELWLTTGEWHGGGIHPSDERLHGRQTGEPSVPPPGGYSGQSHRRGAQTWF